MSAYINCNTKLLHCTTLHQYFTVQLYLLRQSGYSPISQSIHNASCISGCRYTQKTFIQIKTNFLTNIKCTNTPNLNGIVQDRAYERIKQLTLHGRIAVILFKLFRRTFKVFSLLSINTSWSTLKISLKAFALLLASYVYNAILGRVSRQM